MSNTIKGSLYLTGETVQVSDSFKKREFVVQTAEQYPQLIQLQLTQDKCNLIDNFKHGQNVTVSVNIKGREWVNPQGEKKFFNTLEAWKIEGDQPVTSAPQPSAPVSNEKQDDDLPF